jgi:thiosulfate/3-mercaptopyruvate sulfurtransferase
MSMDTLVTPEWLADALGAPDLVVLESTKYLPNEGKDGHEAFLKAHIPGARYFDLDVIADVDSDLPHMVPSAGRFARLVAALGVSDRSRVVFYDQNATMWATRGWWMMGLFGHDQVAVLDGGLAAWQAAGRPTESGEPPAAAPGRFTPRLRATRLRGLGDMLNNTDALVLDARGAARFAGRSPEPRPGVSPGHIPGSINLPYSALVGPDGTFLPPDALRKQLTAVGADSRPVIASCGSGVSATMIAFALVRAGLPQGAIYDGSWAEWGASPITTKETS